MSDLKFTPSLLRMLERIERNSGSLLMLAVTASSGGEYGKLNKLRGAGYVVKCAHPSVTEGAWPAEALAITEAGRAALFSTQPKRHNGPSSIRIAEPRPEPIGVTRRAMGPKADMVGAPVEREPAGYSGGQRLTLTAVCGEVVPEPPGSV
jgi:hypothetical protein